MNRARQPRLASVPPLPVLPAIPVPAAAPAPADGDVERAVRDIEERAERLAEAVRRVRHASDEEAIHDLRVASRRWMSAGTTWRDLFDSKRHGGLLRRVRKIRQRAGVARDLEVQIALVERLTDDLAGEERERLRHLKDRMVREWLTAVDALRLRLDGRRSSQLGHRVGRELLGGADRAKAWSEAVRYAQQRCVTRAETARALLQAAADGQDDGALHRARIAIKQWRYTLERLTAAGLASDPERLDRLRDVQQALGAVQDLVTLVARVRETADGDEPVHQPVWSRIERAIDERHDAAVRNALRVIGAVQL